MAEQLERKLLRLAADYGMFPPSSHVLVACSGGGDSMCLLTLLWNLRHTLGITLSAAHFNHQLRPEATEEAEFVHNWCAKLGIPCVIGSEAVAEKAAQTGRSLEDTARELRYAFLERTRHDLAAHRIATAHHAQDNSETLLLHLIRGSGLRGLGGIPPVRGNIVRPLLTAQRWEIHSYLTRHHIPYVEDASNQDIRYTRNFIRHEILPLLEQCNPNLNARPLCRSPCAFPLNRTWPDGISPVKEPFVRRGSSTSPDAFTWLCRKMLRCCCVLARPAMPSPCRHGTENPSRNYSSTPKFPDLVGTFSQFGSGTARSAP